MKRLNQMKEEILSKPMLDAMELRAYLLEIILHIEEIRNNVPAKDTIPW
jgi:hypothetical protein